MFQDSQPLSRVLDSARTALGTCAWFSLWPSALHIVLDGNEGMKRVPCGSACVLRAWFNSAALVYALECPPSAGGAGRVPDVESVPGEPSAGNSTSQGLLVHPQALTHTLMPLHRHISVCLQCQVSPQDKWKKHMSGLDITHLIHWYGCTHKELCLSPRTY